MEPRSLTVGFPKKTLDLGLVLWPVSSICGGRVTAITDKIWQHVGILGLTSGISTLPTCSISLFKVHETLVLLQKSIPCKDALVIYCRLWLISACTYSSKWKGKMCLIKNMCQYM